MPGRHNAHRSFVVSILKYAMPIGFPRASESPPATHCFGKLHKCPDLRLIMVCLANQPKPSPAEDTAHPLSRSRRGGLDVKAFDGAAAPCCLSLSRITFMSGTQFLILQVSIILSATGAKISLRLTVFNPFPNRLTLARHTPCSASGPEVSRVLQPRPGPITSSWPAHIPGLRLVPRLSISGMRCSRCTGTV